jgi:hypothetical protein
VNDKENYRKHQTVIRDAAIAKNQISYSIIYVQKGNCRSAKESSATTHTFILAIVSFAAVKTFTSA